FSGGNPWFLANTGYAQAQCRLAHNWGQAGRIQVTPLNQAFLSDYLKSPMRIQAGEVLNFQDPRFQTILENLKEKAAKYLERVLFHTGRDGQMDEQFSRNNGFMMGARDLTWSHASYVRAYN